VNRADFIPDVVWTDRDDGWMVPLNRTDDPDRWMSLVNSGEAVVTQADDGTDEYDGRGIIPTSSSSAPAVMAIMLDLIDVHDGMDVLEIGTGTGYNAALLAERAGSGSVTTIEVDTAIAEHARRALRKVDCPATVIVADGALGYPEHAPYDRVIATASALTVPYAWVEQTRAGGLIVLPLSGSFNRGAFVRLTATEHGTAHGKFHGTASFMRLREQRGDEALWRIWDNQDAAVTTTDHYPEEPFSRYEAAFALGILLRGWTTAQRVKRSGAILLMSHYDSDSWATVTPKGDGEYVVHHEGPRRLWEELHAAYQWWLDAGRPDHTRFGLTVTKAAQDVWLDSPDQVVDIPSAD
jgi:protein-L-isoaspartate(D-aspartate) O-methyltransferase